MIIRKHLVVLSIISLVFVLLTVQVTLGQDAPIVNPEKEIMATGQLYLTFQDPPAAFRGKPFWSWNGDLNQAELFRQIQILKDMGLGGFFMHSRTGLITEYLGRQWFDLTNACADEGAKSGMEAWIYDEDRWPSGSAGGMVTVNPQLRMHFLRCTPVKGGDFNWKDDMVAAFVCDSLEGVKCGPCRRIFPAADKAALQNKTVLIFTVEEMGKSSFYNGFTYVDTMNRLATETYIKLTHEKYLQECGQRPGKSIKGIFTDEPHRGALMCGFGNDSPNAQWLTPWTARLPLEFQSRFGYSLLDNLPELFLQVDGKEVSPVKWRYVDLCQQLFLENFAKPIYDWCNRHNMIFTGHVLHEDSLTAQTAMQGSLMRFYEFMHYPGVDVLTEGNRNYWIVKQLSSAARQLGQQWLLSELYGCTGWQFNFQSHKAVGDWQALFGINLRCPHLSWYTMEGQAKRDYPASIFYQSGWYKDYAPVETYFARLGLILQQGQPCCDLLVLNPIESVWCQIYAGWAQGLSPQSQSIRLLEERYANTFHWLTGNHIDFDYGDEEMISRLYRVEKGNPAILQVGKASYRAVLVSGMTTMRASTLAILKEFQAAGGKVIFAGEVPAYLDAVASDKPAQLARNCQKVVFESGPMVEACKQAAGPMVEITGKAGKAITDIFCQYRQDGKQGYLVAMNMNRQNGYQGVVIRVPGVGFVSEWDCLTGKRYPIAAESKKGGLEFATDFVPSGERVYLITPERQDLPARPAIVETSRLACSGPFAYTLNEDNVCVLDEVQLQIGEEAFRPLDEILKADRAVRSHFKLPFRGGEMVQPWYARKTNPTPAVKGPITLRYPFSVEVVPAGPVTLCVEHPERFAITINGQPLASDKIAGWWIDPAIKTITLPAGSVVAGANTIELRASFHEQMNLEAVYLTGQFGVKLNSTDKILISLPAKLDPGSVTNQGLPFYSGSIRYQVTLPQAAGGADKAFIHLPGFEGACVKVQSAGVATRIIPWQPYQTDISDDLKNDTLEVEVVLTRRNTFGPLHLIPLRPDAYGPEHWETGGAGFSLDYQLYPAGLLQNPEIILYK